jgi:hypothetical protein
MPIKSSSSSSSSSMGLGGLEWDLWDSCDLWVLGDGLISPMCPIRVSRVASIYPTPDLDQRSVEDEDEYEIGGLALPFPPLLRYTRPAISKLVSHSAKSETNLLAASCKPETSVSLSRS